MTTVPDEISSHLSQTKYEYKIDRQSWKIFQKKNDGLTETYYWFLIWILLNTLSAQSIKNLLKNPFQRMLKNIKTILLLLSLKPQSDRRFTFKNFSKSEITREILRLDCSKGSHDSRIPTKFIKTHCDIFTEILYYAFDRSLKLGVFPETMKFADITPPYKKR